MCGQPYPVPRAANAAFQNCGDIQFLTDAGDIVVAAFELEGGSPGNHAQALYFCQSGYQLFCYPVAKVLLVAIAAHVLKRKHCNGLVVRVIWTRGRKCVRGVVVGASDLHLCPQSITPLWDGLDWAEIFVPDNVAHAMAQLVDTSGNGVFGDYHARPDGIKQLVPGDHFPGTACENQQDLHHPWFYPYLTGRSCQDSLARIQQYCRKWFSLVSHPGDASPLQFPVMPFANRPVTSKVTLHRKARQE